MSNTFVTAEQLSEIFAGLQFNLTKMRVVLPSGVELNKARFNILFGGMTYALDNDNQNVTNDAWKAYTQNHNFRPKIIP